MSSLNSFSNVLYFSLYKSITSLVKLIPQYFNLFNAIVCEIVFVISFSGCSLLVYKNANKFLDVDFKKNFF